MQSAIKLIVCLKIKIFKVDSFIGLEKYVCIPIGNKCIILLIYHWKFSHESYSSTNSVFSSAFVLLFTEKSIRRNSVTQVKPFFRGFSHNIVGL